jgi:hypothetical protein
MSCHRKGQILLKQNTLIHYSPKKFSKTDIINMLDFLMDNIYVLFGEPIFQQTVAIPPMGSNCAPLLANLFLYSC